MPEHPGRQTCRSNRSANQTKVRTISAGANSPVFLAHKIEDCICRSSGVQNPILTPLPRLARLARLDRLDRLPRHPPLPHSCGAAAGGI